MVQKLLTTKQRQLFFYTFFSSRSSPNKCQPILFNILKGLQYKCLTSQGAMAAVVSRFFVVFFMWKFQLIFNCFVKKWFYWYFCWSFFALLPFCCWLALLEVLTATLGRKIFRKLIVAIIVKG